MRYSDKLSERIRIYFCYLKDEYSVTFVQIIPYETLSARCDLETLAFGLRLKNSYLEWGLFQAKPHLGYLRGI